MKIRFLGADKVVTGSCHMLEVGSKKILLDCDGDAVIYEIEQVGGVACHTGHASCFYRELTDGAWREAETVLKAPESMYAKPHA